MLSGGPSFFNVEQDLVTEVTVTETYPFDTARSRPRKKTTRQGIGGSVQRRRRRDVDVRQDGSASAGWSAIRARTVDLDAPGNRTVTVDAGGVYAGGGLRLLF